MKMNSLWQSGNLLDIPDGTGRTLVYKLMW
jgi:hypothetical protein